MAMAKSISYSSNDFQLSTPANHGKSDKSTFDQLLLLQWEQAKNLGAFNYSVDEVETRVIPGKYHLVAQMNLHRKTMRRTPEEILHVEQPFNPDKFNFTKIKQDEQLMQLSYQVNGGIDGMEKICKGDEESCVSSEETEGSVVINNAPICTSHSLLVPYPSLHMKQVATAKGLALAVHTLLLSHTADLRIAFNSLGGYASVNHFHFHLYYLPYKLYIETAECVQLAGPCYTFRDYYAPGFVFQLNDGNVFQLARRVAKLVELFTREEVAHNIYMTRGNDLCEPGEEYTTIRVIIWARKFCSGIKDVTFFAAAACELAGHVPVYCHCVLVDIKLEMAELQELADKVAAKKDTIKYMEINERTLKRYLVALLTVDAAYEGILETNKWRGEYGVAKVTSETPGVQRIAATKISIILEERDKLRRPVIVVAARNHSVRKRNMEDMSDYIVYCLETICSRCLDDGPDNLTLIFDLRNFTLMCMDYSALKTLFTIMRDHYPERLGVCLILNAPYIFSACWVIIRSWLDERTANKVKFINKKEEMAEFIDPDVVPYDF